MIPVWLALSLTLSELPAGVERPNCPEGTQVDVEHHSDSIDLFCFYDKPDAYNCGTERVRNGPFVSYYASGKIKKRYLYDEGKPSGLFMSWYENGQLKSHGMVIPRPEGWKDPIEWECIRPGYYFDGTSSILDGVWVGYYENGNPWYVDNYEAAYRSGLQTSWYEDGTKEEETEYHNDKKEGLSRLWHPNGKPFFIGSFDDDVPIGMWLYWHEDGELIAEGRVTDGKGVFKEYDKTGFLRQLTPYDHGQKNGEGHDWFRDSYGDRETWHSVFEYENGVITKETNYVNDVLSSEMLIDTKTSIQTERWYDNGKLDHEFNWLEGKQHGPTRFWYLSGPLMWEQFYDHDRPVGIWTKYDENGKIIEQVNHDKDTQPEAP